MKKNKKDFKKFKEKALQKEDTILSMLLIDPLSTRIAYFIKKHNLNISPNQISLSRTLILFPLIVLFLFIAPFFHLRILYLFVAVLFYLDLLTDNLDGQLARGSNRTSHKGHFLDAIGDRCCIIIFFAVIFSIGLWTNNMFLLCGSITLFALKTFHMMIITKLYYLKEANNETKYLGKVFSGRSILKAVGVYKLDSAVRKLNVFLKIKRLNYAVLPLERYLATIVVPVLLIVFNLELLAILLSSLYVILFILFFIERIKYVFKEHISTLSEDTNKYKTRGVYRNE